MFTGLPLKVSSLDGHNFVLLEPFSFTRPDGSIITVPAGSESDGASTPRAIWPTMPPFGIYWPAAYLHDWAYRYSDLDKATCDNLLMEGMRALNVSETERILIYEGVHLAGQEAFNADRAARKAQSGTLTGILAT